MEFKKVVVAGGGVLGSQIAFQAAYCGKEVTIWLRSQASIGRTQPKLDNIRTSYVNAIHKMADVGSSDSDWCCGIADKGAFSKEACLAKVDDAYSSIRIELDLSKALAGADLVIESVSEDPKTKKEFYSAAAALMEEDTVIVTNSSTMLPSTFAEATGRPEKYLSLHFANSIWKHNTAEVMAQAKTSQESFSSVVDFANQIRMVALPVLKEKNGYLLNSMLVPFLLSGLDMYVNGVSDPESIDKAWKLGTGAPHGPFEIFDTVGVKTAYNIVLQYQKVPGLLSPLLKKMMMPYNFKGMEKVLSGMIAEGKLGKSTKEGFYKY